MYTVTIGWYFSLSVFICHVPGEKDSKGVKIQLSDSLWWRQEDKWNSLTSLLYSDCMGLWNQLRGRCAHMQSSVSSPILLMPNNPTLQHLPTCLWICSKFVLKCCGQWI
jgi:hypothetical protein